MADHLASIYGTEKDKVNCSFYFKIGACRHGDRCSRKHIQPNFSQTVLIPNEVVGKCRPIVMQVTNIKIMYGSFQVFCQKVTLAIVPLSLALIKFFDKLAKNGPIFKIQVTIYFLLLNKILMRETS